MAEDDAPLTLQEELVYMEAQTWESLKDSGKAMIPFLAKDCVMIFPGASIFDSSSKPTLNQILERSDMKPWTEYQMQDVRVVPLDVKAAMICYSVEAKRPEAPTYEALISSVWRKERDSWKMCLHQQTPVHV
ncbi:MAG: hypothetical protein M1828_007314 [Chrysothrix sp. TS-e1954]|nr:MAG: hypothetical protein M1828_007314 [Chrysothrix sp. TS-e1954]